ncbi:NADH dehydrogenase [Oopsacas minuta]|uniref:NADH dehydrogenase [ubiquinone] 1 beta subcomplex subunit 7 n=1 Tax=Oopsacas minuta TaxID=111878 RepID=A0AAV7JDE2_9METZ|nr:NADH dehydrogenase [Oopsacas minuta]
MADKYTVEDLERLRIPLFNRDSCVHYFIPFIECRRQTYFMPWHCKEEMEAWNHCQLEDHYDRVRQKRRQDKERKKALREANLMAESIKDKNSNS